MQNTKNLVFFATLLLAMAFKTSAADPQHDEEQAAIQAKNDFHVQLAVATASRAWKDAFNAGDAKATAALYEENATMVVKPFGTFRGRAEIFSFWSGLMSKGFDDVVYNNTVTTVLDAQSARVAADWKMNNAQGVITNEHWVVQSDGRALLREDHFEVAQ